MKKIRISLLLFLFVLAAANVFAQSDSKPIKHFRVNVGGGVGAEQSKISGVVFLEPSWRITNFAFGVRFENLYRSNTGMHDHNLVQSWSVNSQYYLLKREDLRIYSGLGVGLFTASNTYSGACDCSTSTDGSQLGLYPRVGAEFGHLNVLFEYNVMHETEVTTHSIMPGYNNAATDPVKANTNYVSMKLGVRIGGGAQ